MLLTNSNFILVVEDALKRQAKSKKKSKKGQATSVETRQQEGLESLRRRLSELQSTAAEDLTPSSDQPNSGESPVRQEISGVPQSERDPQIEELLESALQVRQAIDSMVADHEMPADGYEHLLQSSMVHFKTLLFQHISLFNHLTLFSPPRDDPETRHLLTSKFTGTFISFFNDYKNVTVCRQKWIVKERQIYDRFLLDGIF